MYYIIPALLPLILRILYQLLKRLFKDEDPQIPIAQGHTLGILGQAGVGKTTLYRQLNKDYKGSDQTFEDNVSSFKVTIDGKEISIAEGVDIGGAKPIQEKHWVNFLNEKNIIFYIFDLYEYFNNTDYKRDVNGDFKSLYSKQQENGRPEHIRIIPSHTEKFKGINALKKSMAKLKEELVNKEYGVLYLKNPVLPVNLSDERQVKEIEKQLFGALAK